MVLALNSLQMEIIETDFGTGVREGIRIAETNKSDFNWLVLLLLPFYSKLWFIDTTRKAKKMGVSINNWCLEINGKIPLWHHTMGNKSLFCPNNSMIFVLWQSQFMVFWKNYVSWRFCQFCWFSTVSYILFKVNCAKIVFVIKTIFWKEWSFFGYFVI